MPLAVTTQTFETSVLSLSGAVPLRVTTMNDPASKYGGGSPTESSVITSSPSVPDSVHVTLTSSSVAAVSGVKVLASGS